MKSDHAKDRDSKMKYIEKAVFCVSFAVGETLSVKPGKVVAGQEPEKTNEFLQMLARVVKEKIDTKEHVKRVLNGMTIADKVTYHFKFQHLLRRETGLEQGEQQRSQRRQTAEGIEREQGPLRLEVAVQGQRGCRRRRSGAGEEQEVELQGF